MATVPLVEVFGLHLGRVRVARVRAAPGRHSLLALSLPLAVLTSDGP
jgi:hypothetical protein